MKDFIKIILILLFFLCYLGRSRFIEDFGNYKATCKNVPSLLKQVLKERELIRNDDSFQFFIPCSYNTCEKTMKVMENKKKGIKYYMIDNCDWINSKARLWTLLKIEHGIKNATKYMPRTYLLDREEDMVNFFKDYKKKKKKEKNLMYILKNNKQRQRGLKITNKDTDIKNGVKDGYVIVQEMYKNPFLVDGRKINFRYYLLVVCNNNKISGYIYNDGFCYYTPKKFKKGSLDFDRNVTTGYIDRKVYEKNPLTLCDFRDHLEKKEKGLSKLWDKRVEKLMKNTIQALEIKICTNKKYDKNILFQLFGADVAPNVSLHPKLMEINKGPDLGAKDKKDKQVKLNLQRDIFKLVDPMPDEEPGKFTKIF